MLSELTIWKIIIFIAIFLILIVAVIVFVKKNKNSVQKEIENRWDAIADLLNYRKEMNYKLAVIEADRLLYQVLASHDFNGADTVEKLTDALYKYPKLKKYLWAGKVKRRIDQDKNFHLKFGVAVKIIKIYKKALKELNAL